MALGFEEVRVGHWTDPVARTGCTVLIFPDGTVASAEVRGGAPASRELELLAPERTVDRIDAAVLTGGSAFGLASADGVMRFCAEQGRGVATPAGPVPIVPTLGLYDLMIGDASVRPGPDQGYAAAASATPDGETDGLIGAGAGATVAKITGTPRPGGLRSAVLTSGDLVVAALCAVNAFGSIDHDGTVLERDLEQSAAAIRVAASFLEQAQNTTIGVVITNARLDKLGCLAAAQGAHDGLARAIAPPHTSGDGDAFIAAATGRVDAPVDLVRLLAVAAVERAIRTAP
ncbi:P1 family peptidase [Microlunatus parietis]|uniref:L-aminopeptidase/D-esterase-like protein n=1 Tax=Microlunatus parietis TaxID=682979 RepID=A0A7Y9I2Z2_9ACTN|nr:P1 family peptidase [Microlunatus parietis]NYE69290.1 L-aminopeptidase/D-esterase-like protein [Microlunatus parietis]